GREAVADILRWALQHGCREDAGSDRHHAYPVACELARRRQGEGDDAALGRAIGGLADLSLIRGNRGSRDDDATFAVGPRGRSALTPAAASAMGLKLPIRLPSTTRRNASSGNGPPRPTMRPAVPMPAQLTAIRTGPCRSRAVAKAASTDLASATSAPSASP